MEWMKEMLRIVGQINVPLRWDKNRISFLLKSGYTVHVVIIYSILILYSEVYIVELVVVIKLKFVKN